MSLQQEKEQNGVLVAYTELCHSYNAIRQFRARLLGLLPLASAGGVFLFLRRETEPAFAPGTLILVGVLGCLMTAGLYLYERHNMARCHGIIQIGARWEAKRLHLKNGQFMMRVNNQPDGTIAGGSQYQLAAALIYGAVALGWLYLVVSGILQAAAGM